MEFVVLHCIAEDQILGRSIVLKGGNALRFACRSSRSTKDLDFSVDADGFPNDVDQLRKLLDHALARAERRFGAKAKCQRVKKNPPTPNATHPTYDVAVGYQLPQDRYYHNFTDRDVPTVVTLEISFGDLICETTILQLGDQQPQRLRVCTLEDIVAEKLRALLQQAIRNRHRPQDVYDIALYRREPDVTLNLAKVADYLKRKSEIRNIHVGKARFDDEIRDMAKFDYDKRMEDQVGETFIPFEEAWNEVLRLVRELDIPE